MFYFCGVHGVRGGLRIYREFRELLIDSSHIEIWYFASSQASSVWAMARLYLHLGQMDISMTVFLGTAFPHSGFFSKSFWRTNLGKSINLGMRSGATFSSHLEQ